MTTNATIGYGTKIAIEDAPGSGVYVELAEVFNVTPPTIAVADVEATHYQSPGRFREYISGLKEGGEVPVEMNYVPGSATDARLTALQASGEVLSMRVTFPNDVKITFPGKVSTYEASTPVDDRMTITATMKVCGQPVQAAAAAPANTVLPAISGIAQVGQTLTAWEGVWTNAPSFAYQWQQDDTGWANIAGAVGKTYAPVVGNVGNALRVIVTGTNTAGSASATSQPTADTLAE